MSELLNELLEVEEQFSKVIERMLESIAIAKEELKEMKKAKIRQYYREKRKQGYFDKYKDKYAKKDLPKVECPHCKKMVKYLAQHCQYNHATLVPH